MFLFLLTDKYLLSLSRWNEIDGEPENWAAVEYCRRHTKQRRRVRAMAELNGWQFQRRLYGWRVIAPDGREWNVLDVDTNGQADLIRELCVRLNPLPPAPTQESGDE